jgi:hypothetical protein
LVDPGDLIAFPGAPFDFDVVDAAVAGLRNSLGWHVAPPKNETVTVDARGGRYLFLPTLKATAVTLVQDVTGTTPVTITDYFIAGAGTLARLAGWPCREQAVAVTMTHGYDACPADLLQVVAELCQASGRVGLQSVRIDDYSESYMATSRLADQHPFAAAYRVPRRSR